MNNSQEGYNGHPSYEHWYAYSVVLDNPDLDDMYFRYANFFVHGYIVIYDEHEFGMTLKKEVLPHLPDHAKEVAGYEAEVFFYIFEEYRKNLLIEMSNK